MKRKKRPPIIAGYNIETQTRLLMLLLQRNKLISNCRVYQHNNCYWLRGYYISKNLCYIRDYMNVINNLKIKTTMKYVYQLKAVGIDGMSCNSLKKIYSTTVFLTREVASSKIAKFRKKLIDGFFLLDSDDLQISIEPLEIIK